MKIKPNQDFLDGTDRYEKDEEYDVPEAKAAYFVQHGWADSEEAAAVLGDDPRAVTHDIEVEGASHGQTSEVK